MGRIIRLFFAFFIFTAIIHTSSVRVEYPGVTPGSFSVSDSGAANYTLPISVPAGVAGMSPELAVTYSLPDPTLASVTVGGVLRSCG